MINPATFILMIIIGASPPQQRGEFHSYHHCYEAAQSEIANHGANMREALPYVPPIPVVVAKVPAM